MSLIVVTSSEPGAGKTGIAAAVARHFAYRGVAVQLARVAASGQPAEEVADATFFSTLDFVPGTPPEPLQASQVADPGAGRLLVCEADLAEAAEIDGASVVLVTRDSAPADVPQGMRPLAVIVTAVNPAGLASVPGETGGTPLVALAEDRTLTGFGIPEIRGLIRAEVLVEGASSDDTCDYLVIAPIGSDAGQPYFRRFEAPAVIARFDKTDMHLAALRADPRCLILTGGRYPSDYVYDAARATEVTVLLSPTDTENTVIALEGIWDRTRFRGQRKLDRMCELLEASGLFQPLEAEVEA